jgi:hypothetical protein
VLGHLRRADDAVVVNAQYVSPHAAGLIEQMQLESRKLFGPMKSARAGRSWRSSARAGIARAPRRRRSRRVGRDAHDAGQTRGDLGPMSAEVG